MVHLAVSDPLLEPKKILDNHLYKCIVEAEVYLGHMSELTTSLGTGSICKSSRANVVYRPITKIQVDLVHLESHI